MKWRAALDMNAELLAFDPRLDNGYKMILRYESAAGQGKSSMLCSSLNGET